MSAYSEYTQALLQTKGTDDDCSLGGSRKVYAHKECIERRKGVLGHVPHPENFKFRVSEMLFPKTSEEHFNK